jgi:hypothetical protein
MPSKIRLLFKAGLELDITVKFNVEARKVTLIFGAPHPSTGMVQIR